MAYVYVNNDRRPRTHPASMSTTTFHDRLLTAWTELPAAKRPRKADLARQLHISRATVGDWFKGRALPRPDNLFGLADALGVEARWLSTGIGPRARLRVSQDNQALLDVYHRLNDPERATVRLLLTQIAESRGDYRVDQ